MSPALRRHGSTIAILVATLGLGAYLYFDHAPTTQEQAARRNSLLPVFRGDDVSEIRIVTDGHAARVFHGARNDAGQRPWQVEIDGAKYPAEEMVVDQLLGSLRDGVAERRVANISPEERATYGVDAPHETIDLDMGEEHAHLRFGGPAPARPGSVWVEVEGHGAAIISPQLAAALTIMPDELRRRALVSWEASDLDALTLEGAGGPRRLVRAPWRVPRGGAFRFDGSTPEGTARVSEVALDQLWEALGQLKVDAFLTEAEAANAPAPEVTVTLAPHGAPRVSIAVGGACPGHPDDTTAVRREAGAPLVAGCVPRGVIPALSVPAANLVDRHLVGARADEVIDVKLEEGGHAITLARSGAHWHEQTPVDRAVEPDVGRAFLDRLLEVQASSLAPAAGADLAALGLSPPRATVRVASTLGDGRGERIELVEVSAEHDGTVHARRVEDGVVATLPAGAAEALLPDDLALRSKKALDLKLGDVRSLRVTGPLGTQRFERSPTGEWKLLDPHDEGLAPDAALLTELAEALAGLSVERWVGAARPEQGLDRPRIVIAADVADGSGTRPVEVALGAPSGTGAFARLQGDPAVFVAPHRLEAAADRWLFNRGALVVDVEHVTRVTLAGERGKKLVLADHDGALSVEGAAAGSDAPTRAAAVRDALGDLMADGVVSVGPPSSAQGLDRPVLKVTVEALGGAAGSPAHRDPLRRGRRLPRGPGGVRPALGRRGHVRGREGAREAADGRRALTGP